jgi:histidinol-phosphate aminotransferase
MNVSESIFKPYIIKKDYDGGITRSEITLPGDDITIWKLSSNENVLGPSPLAQKAIIDNVSNLHEYGFRDDHSLKEAICDAVTYLRPENIVTANSGIEVLELISRAFIQPGSECIISSPTFIAYKNMIENEGGITIDIPLNPMDYTIDVEGILAGINNKTKMVFLTNPNNPTGTYTNKETLDYLINNLPEDIVIVYDEVYYHFVDVPDYPRAIDYIENGKTLIGIHSFSKAYGLAGIRLGYGISNPEISAYLNNIKRPFMINTLSMVAGIHALKDVDHLNKTLTLIKSEKRWLYKKFETLGIKYWPSQTNFIFFEPKIDLSIFINKMLRKGIMIRPCQKFGAPNGARVTIGTREANTAFVHALENIY